MSRNGGGGGGRDCPSPSLTAEEEGEAASCQGVSEYCMYGDIYHISHLKRKKEKGKLLIVSYCHL